MPNLVVECAKRKELKKFISNFKNKHNKTGLFPSRGSDFEYETYKIYSVGVVKDLYVLKQFIKKRLIHSDYELIYVLKANRSTQGSYLKLVYAFTNCFNESFVDSLKESIYDTARKIQFTKLDLEKQLKLINLDDYFKKYEVEFEKSNKKVKV